MRPKALKAKRTLTPLETPEFLVVPGKLPLALELGVELGVEVVVVWLGTEEVKVTPTERHIATAAAMD